MPPPYKRTDYIAGKPADANALKPVSHLREHPAPHRAFFPLLHIESGGLHQSLQADGGSCRTGYLIPHKFSAVNQEKRLLKKEISTII